MGWSNLTLLSYITFYHLRLEWFFQRTSSKNMFKLDLS